MSQRAVYFERSFKACSNSIFSQCLSASSKVLNLKTPSRKATEFMKENILLHTCCAPCIGYVFELLKSSYRVIPYFYNPNIAPESEYIRRLNEIKRFSEIKGFEFYAGNYDIKEWTSSVKRFRFAGERSERCLECCRFRLEGVFNFAKEKGISRIGSTLSISPHKDAGMINKIGIEMEQKYGIQFLEADFKKKDGFKKSIALSKEHGFYRQDYCGCIYSKIERRKKFTGT